MFLFFSVEDYIARGCLINLTDTETKQTCLSNDDTCMSCFTNGCNSHDSLNQLSHDVIAGGDVLKTGARILCNDDTVQVPEVNESNGRGINENENEHSTDNNDIKQDTPKMLSCYHCNSDDNKNCVSDLSVDHIVLCPQNKGCYHKINGE